MTYSEVKLQGHVPEEKKKPVVHTVFEGIRRLDLPATVWETASGGKLDLREW